MQKKSWSEFWECIEERMAESSSNRFYFRGSSCRCACAVGQE